MRIANLYEQVTSKIVAELIPGDDNGRRRSGRRGVMAPDWRKIGSAIMEAEAGLLGGENTAADRWIVAIGDSNLLIFFVVLVGFGIAAGVPIAFCFGISTIAYVMFATTAPVSIIVDRMDQGMSSTELLAVPMFVLLGLLLEMSGIARVLVELLSALVGHKRGGLSYVLLAAMYLISGISGSVIIPAPPSPYAMKVASRDSTSARFASLAVPITKMSRSRATCAAATPTPALAPLISNVWPGPTPIFFIAE